MNKFAIHIISIGLLMILFFFSAFFLKPTLGIADFAPIPQLPQNSYTPNEVIVKFKTGQSPTSLQVQANSEKQQQSTLFGKVVALPQQIVSTVTGQKTATEKLQALDAFDNQNGVTVKTPLSTFNPDTFVYKANSNESVNNLVSQYTSQPEVEYAEPNYIYHTFSIPSDKYFDNMWSLKKIRMPEAWDITTGKTGSDGVLVADIDSGIMETHPDLQDNITEVKSMTPCGNSGDQVGHGTHTAGTIGAVGNNSIGTVGISWHVRLLILKVGCSGSDMSLSSITSAINYASQKGAKAINMSLGGPGVSQTMSNAIANAVQNGTAVVVAAGNDGIANADSHYPQPNYPAVDPNAITVSATGPNDELSHYSSYGDAIDVAAPGGDPPGHSDSCTLDNCILSTWNDGHYAYITGTSMATPHVTGLVGLMFAKDPTLTPARVKQILQSTAVDLGTKGWDNKFGAGRIDAKAALDAVSGTSGPSITPIPTSILTIAPTIPPHSSPTPQPNANCTDYNHDGLINLSDFEAWRRDYVVGDSTLKCFNIWRKAYFAINNG